MKKTLKTTKGLKITLIATGVVIVGAGTFFLIRYMKNKKKGQMPVSDPMMGTSLPSTEETSSVSMPSFAKRPAFPMQELNDEIKNLEGQEGKTFTAEEKAYIKANAVKWYGNSNMYNWFIEKANEKGFSFSRAMLGYVVFKGRESGEISK